MTVKEGDQLWVPVTVAGVIGEDGYKFWTDDTWFRDGDQLPLSPALPAVAKWLAEHGDDGLRLVIPKALEVLDKYDNRRTWTDAITGLRALLAALEQPV